MHAKADAPNTRLAVAAVPQVSLGICSKTLMVVMSTMLLITCQVFTVMLRPMVKVLHRLVSSFYGARVACLETLAIMTCHLMAFRIKPRYQLRLFQGHYGIA